MSGDLTMCGVTKPIVFNTTYNGKVVNPHFKTTSVGFTINGKLNRSDFNLGGEPLMTGVSDEIVLRSNVEFVVTTE